MDVGQSKVRSAFLLRTAGASNADEDGEDGEDDKENEDKNETRTRARRA